MAISAEDLDNRFRFHPPRDDAKRTAHETVRAECRALADKLVALVPDGREQAVAITKIEEAMFWANAGLAREA